MIKGAKTRLVKYLAKKTPDQISKIVKEKNLGSVLGKNRRIKTLSGGGVEGATELVGDPRLKDGLAVRKFYDVADSPVASIRSVVSKTKKQRILNKDPKTKNLFAKYVPGSLKISPNKKVVSVNSEYVPDALNFKHKKHVGRKAERSALKVLGERLGDISSNAGNVRGKVTDFVDKNSIRTYADRTVAKKMNPGKKVSDRLRKGVETHPSFKNHNPNLRSEVTYDRFLGKAGKEGNKTLEQASLDGFRYTNAKNTTDKEEIISNLKKKFYSKK